MIATATPTQIALHEAKKARMARMARMASRVKANDNERRPFSNDVPLWLEHKIQFDAHVHAAIQPDVGRDRGRGRQALDIGRAEQARDFATDRRFRPERPEHSQAPGDRGMTDIEAMAKLWNKDGLSMGKIASHYSMTRQQVAGIIHRNRDKFESRRDANGKKPRKPIVTASQSANQRRKAFHAVKVAEEAAAAPVEIVEPEIDGKEYDAARLPMAKDLMGLASCHCRWPLTDIGPHLFCCAEVVTGSPYCAHHRKRSKGRGTISEQRAIKDARWAA